MDESRSEPYVVDLLLRHDPDAFALPNCAGMNARLGRQWSGFEN